MVYVLHMLWMIHVACVCMVLGVEFEGGGCKAGQHVRGQIGGQIWQLRLEMLLDKMLYICLRLGTNGIPCIMKSDLRPHIAVIEGCGVFVKGKLKQAFR